LTHQKAYTNAVFYEELMLKDQGRSLAITFKSTYVSTCLWHLVGLFNNGTCMK